MSVASLLDGGEYEEPHDRGADAARAALITQVVAFASGLSPREVASGRRSALAAARARQIAMYLAHTACGWSLARVGAAFGRDRSTAGHACQRVEEWRDDPEMDARLEAMEACLRAAPEPARPELLRRRA